MAPGGAQEFYNVTADYVVYGKTLGGGLPVGVVCGKKHLMHRFDKVTIYECAGIAVVRVLLCGCPRLSQMFTSLHRTVYRSRYLLPITTVNSRARPTRCA